MRLSPQTLKFHRPTSDQCTRAGTGFTWWRRKKGPKEVSHPLRSPNMPLGWQSSWSLGQRIGKPEYVSSQRGLSRGLVSTYNANKSSDPHWSVSDTLGRRLVCPLKSSTDTPGRWASSWHAFH